MKTVIVFLYAAAAAWAQSLYVNTPPNGLTACVRHNVVWTGGTGPFVFEIRGGGLLLQLLSGIAGSPYSWYTYDTTSSSLPVWIRITDSTGHAGESAYFTINGSSTCARSSRSSSTATIAILSTITSTSIPSTASPTSTEEHLITSSNSPSLVPSQEDSSTSYPTDPTSRDGSVDSTTDQGSPSSSPNVGAIVGGAVGISAILLLLAFTLWFYSRRKSSSSEDIQPRPFMTTRRGTIAAPNSRPGSSYASNSFVPPSSAYPSHAPITSPHVAAKPAYSSAARTSAPYFPIYSLTTPITSSSYYATNPAYPSAGTSQLQHSGAAVASRPAGSGRPKHRPPISRVPAEAGGPQGGRLGATNVTPHTRLNVARGNVQRPSGRVGLP